MSDNSSYVPQEGIDYFGDSLIDLGESDHSYEHELMAWVAA